MDWPANFPDLNPMENLWAILCRSVYAGGKQYTNITELKAAIISSWENIEVSKLQKLVGSMCDPAFKVPSLVITMSWLYLFCNTRDMLKVALCVNSKQ